MKNYLSMSESMNPTFPADEYHAVRSYEHQRDLIYRRYNNRCIDEQLKAVSQIGIPGYFNNSM